MPCLSAGHLRVLGGRARAVYRTVGRVAVVVVAPTDGGGAAGAPFAPSGPSAFAALGLASAVARLLVAECKAVDVTQERVERRFAQIYLGVASLLARGSGDVVQALLDVGSGLGALSGDASKAKKARLLADAAAAAAAKTARPVGKRLADPRAAIGGAAGAWPGASFAPPAALQDGRGALPMPAFAAPPFPRPDAPRRRPGAGLPYFLKDEGEEAKKEEEGRPPEAAAAADEAEADPFSGDAARASAVPSGPALRLLEVWGAESHGARCLRAGLVGAVRWASAETKAVSGSVPFGLALEAPVEAATAAAAAAALPSAPAAAAGGDEGPTAAAAAAAAAAQQQQGGASDVPPPSPPTPTVDRSMLRLALQSAVAAAGAAAGGAASAAAAGGGGVRPGPVAGSLLADGIAPLPASSPLLRYALPAALSGPPPLMAHLTAGVVPYRLKKRRQQQQQQQQQQQPRSKAGGDAADADASGQKEEQEQGGEVVSIVLVTLRYAVTREGLGEGRRPLGDLTLQLDVPRALGDPLRVDPSSASVAAAAAAALAAAASAAAAAAAAAAEAEAEEEDEEVAAPSPSGGGGGGAASAAGKPAAATPRRGSHAGGPGPAGVGGSVGGGVGGKSGGVGGGGVGGGCGPPEWCPSQGALRWTLAAPFPELAGSVSAAFRVPGGAEAAALLLAAPAGSGQGGGGLRAVARLRGAAGAGTLTGAALLQARPRGDAGARAEAGRGGGAVELALAPETCEWSAVVVARPGIVSVAAPSRAAMAAEAGAGAGARAAAAAAATATAMAAAAGESGGGGDGGGGDKKKSRKKAHGRK